MKTYICIILIALVFVGCSKDDGVTTFSANSINFVQSDGRAIVDRDCIDPNGQYAIVIEANAVGSGPDTPTKIEFTVNGALYSTTFTNDEMKIIPITLQDGNNIAELVTNGISSSIYVIVQDDFVLVP
ncbi:hypothetical protein [Aquimarina brevivitae]|uniref:Uncharacterized protein n=1 Tax=Aquimarina brevivitae TaxID=323412 RepID=A0A4Q7NZG3_9FLAO|nr:hypothetical protein [Aquimarina brevivitae]RZS92450.1 hypothetical protein EV197_2588 [Aquimarina brevivitae]